MYLIGDIHGDFEWLQKTASSLAPEPLIQLGDFGLGFHGGYLDPGMNLHFLRGNHDDPVACRESPYYLGDWGTFPSEKERVFFLSGAFSIDYAWRQAYNASHERQIWWANEELSEEQLEKAIEDYKQFKPTVMLSHECPSAIGRLMFGGEVTPDKLISTSSRTAKALQRMFEAHQPSVWCFGHYHVPRNFKAGLTTFICLGINEIKHIEL